MGGKKYYPLEVLIFSFEGMSFLLIVDAYAVVVLSRCLLQFEHRGFDLVSNPTSS